MASKKTFSQILTSPSPKPSEKPTAWEKYLFNLIQQLQQSNKDLQEELEQANQHIKQLELQVNVQGKQTEEIITKVTTPNTEPSQQDHLVKEVISQINEKSLQEYNKTHIRVGGLTEGWQEVEVLEEEEIENDTYVPEYEILQRKVSRAIPFIEIGEPIIQIKGKHVVLKYIKLQDKIKVMKQARSLQGTKIWMADELTPTQLKNRKQELAKVYEARKQGKWAVYRNGTAIIEDFRTKVDIGWILLCT